MIKSFRLRITVWYLAFFTALFVLFSLFLYGTLARSLQARTDEALASAANTGGFLLLDEFQELGDIDKAALEVVTNMHLRTASIGIFLDGRMLAASDRGAAKLAWAAAQAAPSTTDLALDEPVGSNGWRATVHRVHTAERDFLIVAGQPLDATAAELRIVRGVLLLGLPVLLALAGFGGYWLASRSLAPLQSMASQAREISSNNLQTRLEIGNAAEELTTLSASFNELLARLDQSFETMRRFVADASHELRTPLSVIRGEADVALSRKRTAEEYEQSLTIILDESRHLSRLINDLLNLARADAGHVKLETCNFDFDHLLADCCRGLQSVAAAGKIELECRAPHPTPFRGDEVLLRRLILNLLDNAIRYTPAGGKVTAELLTEPQGVRLRISDTGVGIAPEAAPHVFERFYRSDRARSRADGGFGLGLSIVKWIAESHHGAVELDSKPAKGSTFTVTLPR